MDATNRRHTDLSQITRKLELDSLRLLSVVCQEGSYAKASRIEPLTASAISKRIADLERAMSCVLLDRSNQGVRPTVAGELILSKWGEMAASLSAMLSATDSMSVPEQVQLALVADEDASRFLVFDCLGHLDAIDEAAKVAVTRVALNWLPVEFEKMAMHGAVWSLKPSSMQDRDNRLAEATFDKFQGTRHFRFSAEVCVAVVRDDHPLAPMGLLSAEDLSDFELVCASSMHAHYTSRMAGTDAPRPAATARPSWSYQIGSTLEYLASVPTGVVALLPTSARYLVHRFPGIRCLTLTEDYACLDFGCSLRNDAWLQDRLQLLERLTGCRLEPLEGIAAPTSWDDQHDTSPAAAEDRDGLELRRSESSARPAIQAI